MTKNNSMGGYGKITTHVDSDLEDLIPDYLENRQEDVRAIGRYLERGDYETIRILGHSMKGSGGGYGFDAITDAGRGIEEAAKAGDSEVIRKYVDDLASYLNQVQVVYE